MTGMGIRGAVLAKAVKTTIPDTSVPCPPDKVNRQFRAPAPNMPWVSDFTCVSTWQGFVYVAFVIDTFANGPFGRWQTLRRFSPGSNPEPRHRPRNAANPLGWMSPSKRK